MGTFRHPQTVKESIRFLDESEEKSVPVFQPCAACMGLVVRGPAIERLC